MSAYRKDEFDTDEMRDGHRIMRNICDEDGIDVVHLPSCSRAHNWDGDPAIFWPGCAWNMVHETYESVLHAYADGHDAPIFRDLDAVLPRGVEVFVVWRYSGGANWTDYGWEYDAWFEWWFDDESGRS